MIDIKNNLNIEKEIVDRLNSVTEEKKKNPSLTGFYNRIILSLLDELEILNNSIPDLLRERGVSSVKGIYVSSREKEKLLETLSIEEDALKAIRKVSQEKQQKEKEIGLFTIISSKMFSNISMKLRNYKFFTDMNYDLRKSNTPLLLTTYISMILFATILSLILGVILAALFIMSDRVSIGIVSLFLPVATFFAFYVYPSSKVSSLRSKIDDELPFAIIHMAAISGSGVTPSQIFEIIVKSPDYPSVGGEMKKIVNQINFYGYSLINSLKNIAKATASKRLAELFNGVASTLASGGSLKDYLEKNSVDTLNDYKLRRRRYITISETYADVYTGLLIAAPLIFMLILVLVNILGGTVGGMTPETMAVVGIGGLVIINIGFLVFLEISQPKG